MGHYVSRAVWWTLGLGLVVLVTSQPEVGAQERVAVCHRPPGNPSNFRILNVAPSDVAAHLGHGDNLVEPEVCDGVDNDCDGVVDNHLQNLGTCTVGQGVCAMTAPVECRAGVQVCTAVTGTPPESRETTCNDKKDNDCDGLTDSEDSDCEGPLNCFVCPPFDLSGRALGAHSISDTELFCRYQLVPNDFFCKYFRDTGLLKQDHDNGFCPPVADVDCSNSR